MICDLLARAGISARVDGEFLAGAGGNLPVRSESARNQIVTTTKRAGESSRARVMRTAGTASPSSTTTATAPSSGASNTIATARQDHADAIAGVS